MSTTASLSTTSQMSLRQSTGDWEGCWNLSISSQMSLRKSTGDSEGWWNLSISSQMSLRQSTGIERQSLFLTPSELCKWQQCTEDDLRILCLLAYRSLREQRVYFTCFACYFIITKYYYNKKLPGLIFLILLALLVISSLQNIITIQIWSGQENKKPNVYSVILK